MNQTLIDLVQAHIAQGRADGLDEDDIFWEAVGAVNAEARK